jgi:hypothetical protein
VQAYLRLAASQRSGNGIHFALIHIEAPLILDLDPCLKVLARWFAGGVSCELCERPDHHYNVFMSKPKDTEPVTIRANATAPQPSADATLTTSSSAAALMEVVSTATERQKVLQADQMLSGLDDAILIALAAEPNGPLADEMNLPDLSAAVLRSLAESNLTRNEKSEDREAGLVDHLKKGGITAGIAYLKSLMT